MRYHLIKRLLSMVFTVVLLGLGPVGMANFPLIIMPATPFQLNKLPRGKINLLIQRQLAASVDLTDYLRGQVQLIYRHGKIAYLKVYLLSKRSFSFKIILLAVDSELNFLGFVHRPRRSLSAAKYFFPDGVCPDSRVDFVVASPVYSDIPSTKTALDQIAKLARAKGYHVARLFDAMATKNTYKNYLNCKGLKAFVSIGHGSNQSILLYDGVLSGRYFEFLPENRRVLSHAVVEFNSCNVFNDPLSYDMINFAAVKRFLGGNTALIIGYSELVTQCFWSKALSGINLNDAIDYCQNHFDNRDHGLGYGRDIFVVGGFGVDKLEQPNT